MSSKYTSLLHVAFCALLLFSFGFSVYSLSIDLAHHYMVVDYLLYQPIESIHSAPAIGGMSLYPRGAHWLAVWVSYFTDSPFVALCLICIVSAYIAYYAFARIAWASAGFAGLAVFLLLCLALTFTRAAIGQEIIGNFFYAQIVGTALYGAALFLVLQLRPEWWQALVVLGAGTLLMFIHLLPALNLFAAFGLFLLVKVLLGDPAERKARIVLLIAFGLVAGAILWRHPAFMNMRYLAQNDGSLEFALSPGLLAALALFATILAVVFTVQDRGKSLSDARLMAVTAAVGALTLMAAQYASLQIFGDGSSYAVKKHMFIVGSTSALAIGATIGRFFPPTQPHGQAAAIVSATGAALLVAFLFWTVKPLMSVRGFTKPINYAQAALETGFPKFTPGNTVAIASSVLPMVRYTVSSTAFRMPFDQNRVNLILGDFDLDRVDYAMIDTSEIPEDCSERYASSASYTIVPVDCLRTVRMGETIQFSLPGKSLFYRSGGWWQAEKWGTWKSGEGKLFFRLATTPVRKDVNLTLNLRPLLHREDRRNREWSKLMDWSIRSD